jgi:hypothetical protein
MGASLRVGVLQVVEELLQVGATGGQVVVAVFASPVVRGAGEPGIELVAGPVPPGRRFIPAGS